MSLIVFVKNEYLTPLGSLGYDDANCFYKHTTPLGLIGFCFLEDMTRSL